MAEVRNTCPKQVGGHEILTILIHVMKQIYVQYKEKATFLVAGSTL